MGQMGFFDITQRYAGLDAKNDPLVKIDEVVPWSAFRPCLETVWRRRPEERGNKTRSRVRVRVRHVFAAEVHTRFAIGFPAC